MTPPLMLRVTAVLLLAVPCLARAQGQEHDWAPDIQASPEARITRASKVYVIRGGQFYHRDGHLTVDGVASRTLGRALRDGFGPCPECTPPHLSLRRLVDPGPSPYFVERQRLRFDREAALSGFAARRSNLRPGAADGATLAAEGAVQEAVAAETGGLAAPGGAPGSTAVAAPAASTPMGFAGGGSPGYGLPYAASGGSTEVPGTGGLLTVPTFQGSGAIVPVPLPYGGYAVQAPAPGTATGR